MKSAALLIFTHLLLAAPPVKPFSENKLATQMIQEQCQFIHDVVYGLNQAENAHQAALTLDAFREAFQAFQEKYALPDWRSPEIQPKQELRSTPQPTSIEKANQAFQKSLNQAMARFGEEMEFLEAMKRFSPPEDKKTEEAQQQAVE